MVCRSICLLLIFLPVDRKKQQGGKVSHAMGAKCKYSTTFGQVLAEKTTAMCALTKNMPRIAMRTAAEAAVFLLRILQSHSSMALDTFTGREKTWQHMQICLKYLTHQPEAFEYMSMPNITLAQIALIFNKNAAVLSGLQ